MGSFEKAELLCRRGLSYLKVAKQSFEQGYYDVASTNCEISAELLLKSTFLYLGYSYPETHQIRKLLSQLSTLVPQFKDEIISLSREKRKELNLIELSRLEGQYSPIDVDSELAKDCLDTLEENLIPLIRKIWSEKWCGD